MGQKTTLQGDRHMSALPQKSDITDLAFGHSDRRGALAMPKADRDNVA
jgi:hypothetical protein